VHIIAVNVKRESLNAHS